MFVEQVDLLADDDRTVAVGVRELSVRQVREWAVALDSGKKVDPIRAVALEDCSLDDLALMSDIDADELEQFGKTQLEKLRDKARAINPHFFKVRAMLAAISRALEAEAQELMPS